MKELLTVKYMRVFLFPLGFHEDPAIRVLVEFKSNVEDEAHAFTCQPLSPGSKRAFESLKAFSSSQRFPDPALVLVNCSSFYESFKVVRGIVEPRDALFIVEVGMGPRIISHAIIQALIYSNKGFMIHYEPETGVDSPITVDHRFLKILREGLSSSELRLLEALSHGEASMPELAGVLGVSEKTVRNIVSRLRAKGLIAKIGKRERVVLTEAGRALV
ncbi:MAG: CRISPR-associated CARF protein Csa3 [Thermosphaera sp.]